MASISHCCRALLLTASERRCHPVWMHILEVPYKLRLNCSKLHAKYVFWRNLMKRLQEHKPTPSLNHCNLQYLSDLGINYLNFSRKYRISSDWSTVICWWKLRFGTVKAQAPNKLKMVPYKLSCRYRISSNLARISSDQVRISSGIGPYKLKLYRISSSLIRNWRYRISSNPVFLQKWAFGLDETHTRA